MQIGFFEIDDAHDGGVAWSALFFERNADSERDAGVSRAMLEKAIVLTLFISANHELGRQSQGFDRATIP
jgi:hypothetical protein